MIILDKLVEISDAIRRVLDLHQWLWVDGKRLCDCGVAYPCPTVVALGYGFEDGDIE